MIHFTPLILLGVLIHPYVVKATTPSTGPTPCYVYSCPPSDEAGFPIGEGSSYDNSDGTTLFCSYPAVPGEDPNDFYCKYADSDGELIVDNDAGFCPATAIGSPTTCTKKRAIVRAIEQEQEKLDKERSLSEETRERQRGKKAMKKKKAGKMAMWRTKVSF